MDKPLLIIMAKWPRYGNCKTRLAKDIGEKNALKIQNEMLNHTFSVSTYLAKNEIAEICLAITGIGNNKSQKWCREIGIKNYIQQGKGCLGEKMKRQIIRTQRNFRKSDKKNLIFIGTDLPNLSHLDILETISKLKKNDAVLGPSNDGGYWLLALSKEVINKKVYPFINIKWSSQNVLQMTVNQLIQQNLKIDYLDTKIDIDTIKDIDQRR